jgi:hypothetical protein
MMLKEYQTHSELNPVLWRAGELRPGLQAGFMKIAEKFYEFLGINTPILDVILIGSNANYNWTKYSDIDLHVVINYMEVGDNLHMTKEYLHLKKALWNHNFPLKYKGINIELYAQDMNEDLHSSVGIYSIGHGKWVSRPKADLVYIDDAAIQQKAAPFVYEIENLDEEHPHLERRVKELLMRLRRLRQTGLEAEGEYSVENLAFKYIRNKGLIDRLKELMHIDTMNQLQVETIVRRELNPVEMLHNHVTKRKILDEAGWDIIIKTTNAVEDAMGQWKHPGRCTMIPSNRITMQNVPHKVMGIDDTGHMQIMHPEQQYEYPGSKVFEIPLTAQQKTLAIQLMNRMKNGKPF